MTNDEKITMIKDRARKNFSRGLNCAECVFEAVLAQGDTGLSSDSLKLATGFGGGIGLYGDTCGAVAGAVLSVSAVHGRTALPDVPDGGDRKAAMQAAKQQLYGRPGIYRIFNQIPNMVGEKYGNTLCREITAEWTDQWLCRDHALHCREIITDVAELAAKLIYSDKEKIADQPFGRNVENLKDEED